jgi:enoyl-[acyl-carrier-protein] reductase (NADH)
MPERIEVPDEFPAVGNVSGKRVVLTGAGRGLLSKTILGHTALNRWGRPADLAGAFQFLASDAAEFVTGTVLNVDGGYLLA